MPNASARLRDRHADPAEADDAQARAADLARQRHRPVRPVAAAHVAVGLDQPARDGEHERDRQVGDLVVEDVGRVRDGDAALARRGDVDAVVADAEHRDELELGQLRDQLARHLRLAARRDRADARRGGGECRGVALVRAVVHVERAVQRFHHRRPELGRRQHLDPIGLSHRAFPSHADVVGPAAAFGRDPDDVLRRVLDVAGLAVHAVLRVDLQPLGAVRVA